MPHYHEPSHPVTEQLPDCRFALRRDDGNKSRAHDPEQECRLTFRRPDNPVANQGQRQIVLVYHPWQCMPLHRRLWWQLKKKLGLLPKPMSREEWFARMKERAR